MDHSIRKYNFCFAKRKRFSEIPRKEKKSKNCAAKNETSTDLPFMSWAPCYIITVNSHFHNSLLKLNNQAFSDKPLDFQLSTKIKNCHHRVVHG